MVFSAPVAEKKAKEMGYQSPQLLWTAFVAVMVAIIALQNLITVKSSPVITRLSPTALMVGRSEAAVTIDVQAGLELGQVSLAGQLAQ